MTSKTLLIDKLAFYWRLRNKIDDKNIVPDFLPFELVYDDVLKIIIQKRNKEVLQYLDEVYKQSPNIGNIQENNQWSNLYGDDFLKFINLALSKAGSKIKKILEIGCGGCILLKSLQDRDYDVTGVDPSPFSLKIGREKGIRVIQDLYPTKKLNEKFDLIFSSDVLEHVSDPIKFLKTQYGQLNNGGILILAIPDSSTNIENGDMSIFLHQHLNYFDIESLKTTVKASGFSKISILKSGYGGSLYCYAKKIPGTAEISSISSSQSEMKFREFIKKNDQVVTSMKSYIEKVINDKERSLGFYAPVRALPYIAVMNLDWDFRFFDDTIYWHNKYFDGISIPIENFEDLKSNPPTDVIIMSSTFGSIIEDKIKKSLGEKVRIKKLTDFFKQQI